MQTEYSRQQNIERQKPQTAKILRMDEEVEKEEIKMTINEDKWKKKMRIMIKKKESNKSIELLLDD